MSHALSDIVADLCARINALESIRQRHFLAWLHKHHRTAQPPALETLSVFLENWLSSLPPQGLGWEVRLLLDEIAWWRNLSAARLWHILEEERSA